MAFLVISAKLNFNKSFHLTNLNNEIQFQNLNQGTQAHDLVFDLLNNNSFR